MIIQVRPQMARRWIVVFWEDAATPFWHWAIPGRFKHVGLLAWLPDAGAWVHVDLGWNAREIWVLPESRLSHDVMGKTFADATLVEIEAAEKPGRRPWFYSCVGVVRHVLGLKCVCLTPDVLYRALIQQGGKVRHDGGRRRKPDDDVDADDAVPAAAAAVAEPAAERAADAGARHPGAGVV